MGKEPERRWAERLQGDRANGSLAVQRRQFIQWVGPLLAAGAGAGCVSTPGDDNPDALASQDDGPIEFGESEELLLPVAVLPGDDWEVGAQEDADILDVSQSFVREFEEDEEVDGEEGDTWLVISSVAGRDDEDEAAQLYADLETEFVTTVGQARVMEFELASEGLLAGYDGLTAAIFRDVNCVASVGFADCVTLDGPCYSDVGRAEALARTNQEVWRDPPEAADDDADDADDEDDPDDDDPAPDPVTFEGEGTHATDSFELERGFLAVAYEHDGTSNFIVNLVDTTGEEPDALFVNVIGSVEGHTADGVDGGEYLLDVQADATWWIQLTQPRPSQADAEDLPVTIDRTGSEYAGPFLFDGLTRVRGQHDGESNFIVEALDADGDWEATIFNEIGSFEGESVFTTHELGWLTVQADGDWTIELEHD